MKNEQNVTTNELSKEELMSLKRDVIFKRFFSKKGNEKFLKDFLERLLKIKIRKIEVIPEAEIIQRFYEDKYGSMDLLVNINNEIVIDIEMQRKDEKNIEKRSSFIAGRIISDQLKVKEPYENINNIIMINILDFKLTDLPKYITETVTVDKDYRNYELMKNIKYYFIELPKFRKSNLDINDKLTQWLILIDGTNKEGIEMAKRKSKIIKEACGEWEYLVGDEATKRMEFLQLKWQLDRNSEIYNARKKGMKQGIEEGIEQGIEQEKIEIAKKMLEEKADINFIIKVTGLTKEEIEKL